MLIFIADQERIIFTPSKQGTVRLATQVLPSRLSLSVVGKLVTLFHPPRPATADNYIPIASLLH